METDKPNFQTSKKNNNKKKEEKLAEPEVPQVTIEFHCFLDGYVYIPQLGGRDVGIVQTGGIPYVRPKICIQHSTLNSQVDGYSSAQLTYQESGGHSGSMLQLKTYDLNPTHSCCMLSLAAFFLPLRSKSSPPHSPCPK